MSELLSYFDMRPKTNSTVPQRCVRALTALAQWWGFAAVMLVTGPGLFGFHGPVAARVRIFGVSALVFALGLYSVIFTLHRIVRDFE